MRGGTKVSRALSRLLIAASGLVCVGAVHAQDYAAKLIVQSGQVSVVKDGIPVALFEGNLVRAQQTIVTGPGGYAKFLLNDGSTFEVFEKSQVVFRAPGSGINELLNLWMGRIKVFIDHSKGPNFKDVSTPTAVISVRGTVFDVVIEDAEFTTFVTVDEGLVGVRNLTSFGPTVLLHQGESIHVYPNQALLGRQIDPHSVFRAVVRAAQEIVYRSVYGRSGSGGPVASTGGGTTGPQGDKCKPGQCTGTGTGTSTGTGAPTTGAPTSGPPH